MKHRQALPPSHQQAHRYLDAASEGGNVSQHLVSHCLRVLGDINERVGDQQSGAICTDTISGRHNAGVGQ